ncbi:MAG TPA: hypothetical protein VN656_01730 [Stellaceae bacterium]|jgi:hypothetical protein|nr:hypothetical protein [Stellaceae bacterium]
MVTTDLGPNFSLIDGGPARNTLRRLKLGQPLSNAALLRNAGILILLTWLPLAVLTSAQGLALSGPAIPFLKDISAHVRFLVALPIFIAAEGAIGARIRVTIAHFVLARLIREEDQERFGQIITKAIAWRDSRIAAFTLLAIVVLASWASARQGLGTGIPSWYVPSGSGALSLAGYWYAFFCLPILNFLILRWVYRLIVLTVLLRQIAKLDLHLMASHPDGTGGLAFLGRILPVFGTIVFALSAMISARIATRVLFGGTDLYDDLAALALVVVLELIIFAGPLMLFMPKLYALREEGLRRYGALGTRYTRLFEKKWFHGGASDEPLLGSGDIQSLADLANSYEVVHRMKIIPAGMNDLAFLVVPAILPALPLAATVVPLSELLKNALKLIA